MEYNFLQIEKKWQKFWAENKVYKVKVDPSKPKFYVLDMFPYPSGAGLHVGHPLGYIASDIYSRYKHLKGFNVLHPMGYDAFGLPAEQYAIQTGQHPAITTEENIKRYREQLDKLGFSYDWEREIRTCEPEYYKWTQQAFLIMFNAYYCKDEQQARPISELISVFEQQGTKDLNIACTEIVNFTAEEWKAKSEKEQQELLLNYRLAYLADTMVNWCQALGTVLANDEVKDGVSERGGYPVEQRKMRQWSLRTSAYAQRLLDDLDKIEWSESLKEIQRNWIGRSEGAKMHFNIVANENNKVSPNEKLEIFTTRPDTIFGVSFMVLAPESEWVDKLTTQSQLSEVTKYVDHAKKRNERERMMDAKTITGVFSGSYAIHPFTNEKIEIWIADYVLAGYGTGAIMAVPAHDSRDYAFAKHFNLPIIPLIEGCDVSTESFDAKEGTMINSDFLNGLSVKEAMKKAIEVIDSQKLGERTINYRLRDAIFSRQRYWGEPFPIYYKDGMPYAIDEKDLPITLPSIDVFLPTETGEPPLGRAKDWTYKGYPIELNTMPGFAGSSAYYLRYMDPKNDTALVDKTVNQYWRNVDLYIGGTEHATGHLVYSRFWNKVLFDFGLSCEEEPFKKLVNQGMIQGRSNFVYRVIILNSNTPIKNTYNSNPNKIYVSKAIAENIKTGKWNIDKLREEITHLENGEKLLHDLNFEKSKNIYSSNIVTVTIQELHVDINLVENDVLDIKRFKKTTDNSSAHFLTENGEYICGWAVEKMSKSYFNVVNPDDIVVTYGADTLRMYEMFLGPLEQSKPWDTKGIDGVHRFLRKFWRLFHNSESQLYISDDQATKDELKTLHRTIKKIQQDIESFSFNTSVSAFMICINELTDLKCNKRGILEPLTILLSPFAPHIAEELWSLLGHKNGITNAQFPILNEEYLVENSFEYPVSFNGKMRLKKELPLGLSNSEIEQCILADEAVKKHLDGKAPKKIIIVPNKIINIVL